MSRTHPDALPTPSRSLSPDYLQLVEFHRKKRKAVDCLALLKHHLPGLPGKPENEMRPGIDASGCRLGHRFPCRSEIMSPVDPAQCVIIARLYPVFHCHKRRGPSVPADFPLPSIQDKPGSEGGQIIQLFTIHAVRSCTYDNPHHGRMGKSLPVQFPESGKRGVCIGIRLEIGKI